MKSNGPKTLMGKRYWSNRQLEPLAISATDSESEATYDALSSAARTAAHWLAGQLLTSNGHEGLVSEIQEQFQVRPVGGTRFVY